MTGTYPGISVADRLPGWQLLFAREPESDLDFDDSPEPSDRNAGTEPGGPEPSKRKPWMLVLGLAVVGGALYFAWDAGLLGPSGDSTPTGPATQGQPESTAPAPPPPPPGTDEGAKPMPQTSPAPPPVMPKAEMNPGLPAAAAPLPAFSEGQRVSVVPDPTLPAAAVSLNGDAGETKPGPLVSPTTVLIVMDGEFRNNGWVYSVRTPDGAVGWISERRLHTAKP